MKVISVLPESRDHWLRLRHQNLNSTEISCLYDCNPYKTRFELWNEKNLPDPISIEESSRMKWGSRLQDVIAQGIAEDNDWKIRPVPEYLYIPKLGIGSSFDFRIEESINFEIKKIDGLIYRREWSDTEPPLHIAFQVQTQMGVAGLDRTILGCLIGGNETKTMEIDFIQDVWIDIQVKVKEFRALKVAPEPDFERDAEYIRQLYNRVNPGKIISADERVSALADAYISASQQLKEIEKRRDGYRSEILTLINDAEKVLGEGFSISCGVTNETVVPSFVRKASRGFRLYDKRVKE